MWTAQIIVVVRSRIEVRILLLGSGGESRFPVCTGQPYSLIKPAQQPWLVVTEAARLAQGRGWDDCILEESATETDWIDDFVHEQLTELEQKETDSNKQMSMAVKAWKIHNRCIHDVLRSGALNSIGPNCKDGPQKWVDLNEMHFGGSEVRHAWGLIICFFEAIIVYVHLLGNRG